MLLFVGILQGCDEAHWEDVPLVGVETKGCDSFAQSLRKGELVTLPNITSIATSLGARRCAPELVNIALSTPDRVVSRIVSDKKALRACLK